MLAYVISGVVLLLAAAVISYPLFFHRLEAYTLPDKPEAVFSERDALLESLSDLEQSFQSGKVSAPDYEKQKAGLQRRYIALVEQRGRRHS